MIVETGVTYNSAVVVEFMGKYSQCDGMVRETAQSTKEQNDISLGNKKESSVEKFVRKMTE